MTTVALVVAGAVALLRAATGLWFLADPHRPARSWVGTTGLAARYLVRAIGGRDLVLGAGLAWALVTDSVPLAWVVASVAADAVDAGTAAAMLTDPHRRQTLIFAVGFGLLGLVAAALLATA